MKTTKNSSILVALILISLATIYRIIPHPHNFAPITGIALFGGAVMSRKYLAIIIPLMALYIGDFIINNTVARAFFPDVTGMVWFSDYMIFNAIAFTLIALGGSLFLKKISTSRVMGAALGSSVLFFVITNFGSWLGTAIYPKTPIGLVESYVAGIPFFGATLLGDMVFTGILFGSYMWITKVFGSSMYLKKVQE